MTSLEIRIRSLPLWTSMSAIDIFNELQRKTIQYHDTKKYDLMDIAKIIGDEYMAGFLALVKSSGREWIITQASVGVPLGDEPVNTRLRAMNHPIATKLADHTRRMISVLEFDGLDVSAIDVENALVTMKLNDYKKLKIDEAKDELQTYEEAMTVWDGDLATEPRFK